MTRRLVAGVLLLLALALPVRLAAQGGPFTAQIEAFWQLISTGGRTFTNISVSGGTISGVTVTSNMIKLADGSAGAPSLTFTSNTLVGAWLGSNSLIINGKSGLSGGQAVAIDLPNGVTVRSDMSINFNTDGNLSGNLSPDVRLYRDAANNLALRNGTNAQTFNVYNTYTDASNNELGQLLWTANSFYVGTRANGTGTVRPLNLMVGGAAQWQVNSSGNLVDQGTHTITASGNIVTTGGVFSGGPFLGPGTTASAGDIRLQNNGAGIEFRNAANSGDIQAVTVNNSNQVVIGANAASIFYPVKFLGYNNITTAGNGVPAIVAYGRSTAQTAAVPSVTTFTPSADGSFEVSANLLATTATSYSINVNVSWTTEDNVARSTSLVFTGGTNNSNLLTLTNANGPYYSGQTYHLRAKSGTAITVLTTGTFTTVTYNVEAAIRQIS